MALQGAAACSKEPDALLLFDVKLAAGLPSVSELRVSVPASPQVQARTIPATQAHVGFYVNGVAGTVTVLGEALDQNGCAVGRGTATVLNVRAGQISPRQDLPIGPAAPGSCSGDAGADRGDVGGDRAEAGDAGRDGGADRGPGDVGGEPSAPGTLIGFDPALSFVRMGQANTPTSPTPLTVQLQGPAAADTFVAISSGDATALVVVGGGVTVRAGDSSAAALVTAVAPIAAVTLTATAGGVVLTAQVRVIGDGEQPTLIDLSPPSAQLAPGGTLMMTVNLDFPAPAGGVAVALSVNPAGAGQLPPSVTVPDGQLSVAFDYVDNLTTATATITAALGAATRTATVTVDIPARGQLIINEIDYNNPDFDTAEFIEIYNAGGASQNLADIEVVLVSGSNSLPYSIISLAPAGALDAGGYLLVGPASLLATVPGVLGVDPGIEMNIIQNGVPDGLALVDSAAHVMLDALSYGGAIGAAQVANVGVVSLVEGTVLPIDIVDSNLIAGSLCRLPNGVDTDDSSVDWHFCGTLTPGAANAP